MKSVIKKIFLFCIIAVFALFIGAFVTFGAIYLFSPQVKFDINKIKDSNLSINIFDNDNRALKEQTLLSNNFVLLNTLPQYVKDSFISIEDKDFYKHNGINIKRIVKATLKNVASLKIKEGASTISQQLIKNTHLSNEKTFSRKINEILLTKKLEKTLSKDEILEYYLNIIYFGDNCYGIENASQHYFNKKAKELSLNESATLAGLIKSPNTYSPIKNKSKSKKRRNLVLEQMVQDKKLDFNTFNNIKNDDIILNIQTIANNSLNTYSQATIDEAMDILQMPEKQIAIGGYKIYTYFNQFKQEALNKAIEANSPNCDYSAISISCDGGKIEAYVAKSNIKMINAKRQPGSTIKPVLVYGPALNNNIISPITQINDEKIDINGYSPNNVNNSYSGYTSVRDCLSKSLNIPAVKILSYVGIDNAKSYAEKCGIAFNANDNNYSIALGGFTDGVSLKELTNSYLPFTNNGDFLTSKFISYITNSNGKIIYKNNFNATNVFRDDTVYLMNDMLNSCVKNGTAKKLGSLDFKIYSKTGTVGKNGKNIDAYNIAYTSNDICGIWLGNANNTPIDYSGSNLPTDINKLYFTHIYSNEKPREFTMPYSVIKVKIDSLSLKEKHTVLCANNFTPEIYTQVELFSKFNLPKEKSTSFISVSPASLDGKIENNTAILYFNAEEYLIYELHKIYGKRDEIIAQISNSNGLVSKEDFLSINDKATYYLITKIKNFADNSEIISEKSNLIELFNLKGNNLTT